jgi:hypothetical protein
MTPLNSTVLLVSKIIALLGLSVYLLFSYIVLKQVSVMTQIVSGNLNPIIKLFSRLHFFVAVFVLLLAFVVL